MNYGVLKVATTPQILHGKYFKNIRHMTLTQKRWSLSLKEKLAIKINYEIARFKGHNLQNKRSEIINKCCHRNKFALALCDSKEWIKFSVTAFEQPGVRDHSFPKSYCFKSSWSQPGFENQCFPVVVSLSGNHDYEVTVSPSLTDSQLKWN